MADNQCGHCGRFFKYDDSDSYTPFGCSSYDPPQPFDPTIICKSCSDKLKSYYKELFEKGNLTIGHWQKSTAECEAAKEAGLIWDNANFTYKKELVSETNE